MFQILTHGECGKGGDDMVPTTIEKYVSNEIGAPSVITSTTQLQEYVCALLEFDQKSQLTAAEENFAELLMLLIESYVKKPQSGFFASPTEVLQELLSTGDPSQTN